MTDAALRALQRRGPDHSHALRVAHLRAQVPLRIPLPGHDHGGHDRRDVWAPARAVLMLRAYAGCVESREVLPGIAWREWAPMRQVTGNEIDARPLADWATGLLRLAADVPPIEVHGVDCSRHGPSKGTPPCLLCKPVPFDCWLAAYVAHAVGRVVLPSWEAWWSPTDTDHGEGCDRLCGGGEWCPNDRQSPRFLAPRRALDAAGAWLRCPCPERSGVISQLVNGSEHSRPDWCWQPMRIAYAWDGAGRQGVGEGLNSAAKILYPETVRAAAQAAVLEVVR